MKRLLLTTALSFVGLLLVAPTAMAQTATTGAVQGVVRDQAGKPLGGVTVIVTSPSLQGEQGAVTDESGSYKITNLPPGTYMAKFYFDKAETRRTNIIVSINRTTPAMAKLDLTKTKGEVIEITAKAPSIDPTSTTQGVTLGQDYTKNIPIPGRTFESALGAAPGSSGDDLGVSFSGSTSLENSYVVDGVNTTGLTYGTVGSPLITDFIQEIEIITGGYNAEYGRATGGVVNVVTKSGSNEFHGQVFTYITPGFAIAERERTPTEASSIDTQVNTAYNMDFGFDLGGPIIKDKVWFYVGFAPRLFRTDVDKITKRRTDCRETLPDGSLSKCIAGSGPDSLGDGVPDEDPETGFLIYEELDRQRLHADQTTYQFVSKLNFALSPEHQGQISLIGTPSSGETVGVRGDPAANTFDYSQLTTDLSAKWTSKFNNNKTEVEAVLGWHRSSFQADSIDNTRNSTVRQNLYYGNLGTWSMLGFESDKTRAGCTDSGAAGDPYPFIENCPDVGAGYSIGGPGSISDTKEQRLSARLGVTQRVKALGNHEIKGGVDIEDNYLDDLRDISGGVYYNVLMNNSVASYNQTYSLRWVRLAPSDYDPTVYDQVCRDNNSDRDLPCKYLGPNNVAGNTTNWSAYLRDSWQIRPNVTFNYGLRYEEQRMRFAKHLQNTEDPFTGNHLGKNAMTMRNMWAPRLGLMYDWTKEGRSKIYGHWGRFFESIPMDINNRSFGGETLYQQVYDSSTQCGPADAGVGGPTGPGCDAQGERPAYDQTVFGSGTLVAPGVKPQYLDEYILGVEYEVMEDLKLGISFQNRKLGRVLEDVSVDNAATYILANPGEFDPDEERKLQNKIDATTDPDEKARLKGQLDQYRKIRIFDKPRRDYNAVQLTATKRFSKSFFVQASYTYSRTEGNYGGLYSADNGQVDPNITSQYDLIELLANRDGPLPQDRPHYFKVDAYYKFDFKKAGIITTGMRLRALSGVPRDALARHYLYGIGESFLLPRGGMGRTSFEKGLDLQLTYGRKLGKGMQFEVFTRLYNVFNSQGTFRVSENYTFDPSNPVVGGDYEDLVFAKRLSSSGGETPDPVRRNRNFGNVTVRYAPFSATFGARLTF